MKFVWIGIAALIVSYQLFVPPVVGLADNNDFPKITGRLPVCPEDRSHDDRWVFVTRRWIVSDACRWDSALPSTEMLWARGALAMSWIFGLRVFDIRWLGALQAGMFLAAFAGFVVWSDSAVLKIAALFMFCDVSYVALFNSFYMDTAAELALFAALVCALWMYRSQDVRWAAAYVIFVWMLVAAKGQHSLLAVPALVPLGPLLWKRKLALAACAVLLVATAGYMLATPPPDYSAQPLWNSIFVKLLPLSAHPRADMRELGLDSRFEPFIGRNAYELGTLEQQVYWRGELAKRAGFSSVLRYYARRPLAAFHRLALAWQASWETRPPYLGNFERSTGFPPRSKSRRYAFWSDFKFWLGNGHPALALLVTVLAGLPILLAAQRLAAGFHYAWLVLGAATGELAIVAFADGMDWGRHSFLAQAMLDVYFCFAIAALLVIWRSRADGSIRRSASPKLGGGAVAPPGNSAFPPSNTSELHSSPSPIDTGPRS
jgi:hypothetical protein